MSFPPPIHGAAMMGKYLMEDEIINSIYHTKHINLNTSKSIEEIGKGGIKKILSYLILLKKVFSDLLKFKPDLCYITLNSNGLGFYKDFGVVLLCKLFNTQLLYHFHNKGVSTRQDFFLDDLLYKLAFKGSKVILLSEYLFYDIEKYVSEDDVYFCPNGIPDENQIIPKKKRYNSKKMLFLSNLIESKGLFYLLSAVSTLIKKYPSIELTIVGGAGDVSVNILNSRINELGLDDHVKYRGKVYGKEKFQIIQDSDIFVFPTFYSNECFPLVLLEAMSFSLPIITTEEGGIRSIVEDNGNGIIVASKDEDSLIKAIEKLLNHPELVESFGNNGRKKFEEQFTIDKFASRIKNILEESIPRSS